jgi:hypothetical protein
VRRSSIVCPASANVSAAGSAKSNSLTDSLREPTSNDCLQNRSRRRSSRVCFCGTGSSVCVLVFGQGRHTEFQPGAGSCRRKPATLRNPPIDAAIPAPDGLDIRALIVPYVSQTASSFRPPCSCLLTSAKWARLRAPELRYVTFSMNELELFRSDEGPAPSLRGRYRGDVTKESFFKKCKRLLKLANFTVLSTTASSLYHSIEVNGSRGAQADGALGPHPLRVDRNGSTDSNTEGIELAIGSRRLGRDHCDECQGKRLVVGVSGRSSLEREKLTSTTLSSPTSATRTGSVKKKRERRPCLPMMVLRRR